MLNVKALNNSFLPYLQDKLNEGKSDLGHIQAKLKCLKTDLIEQAVWAAICSPVIIFAWVMMCVICAPIITKGWHYFPDVLVAALFVGWLTGAWLAPSFFCIAYYRQLIQCKNLLLAERNSNNELLSQSDASSN